MTQRQVDRLGLGVYAVAIHDCFDVGGFDYDVGPNSAHTPIIHVTCVDGVASRVEAAQTENPQYDRKTSSSTENPASALSLRNDGYHFLGIGAAFQLVRRVGQGSFEIAVSVPLVLEYEDALGRARPPSSLKSNDIAAVIDYLCSVAHWQDIFYLWRPLLRDPKDDMVLELAVAAGCDAIVTYNRRDFAETESFGIKVLAPYELLAQIGQTQ